MGDQTMDVLVFLENLNLRENLFTCLLRIHVTLYWRIRRVLMTGGQIGETPGKIE